MKEFTGVIEWVPIEQTGRRYPVLLTPKYHPVVYFEKGIGWSLTFFPQTNEVGEHVKFVFTSELAPVDKVKSGDILEAYEGRYVVMRVKVD